MLISPALRICVANFGAHLPSATYMGHYKRLAPAIACETQVSLCIIAWSLSQINVSKNQIIFIHTGSWVNVLLSFQICSSLCLGYKLTISNQHMLQLNISLDFFIFSEVHNVSYTLPRVAGNEYAWLLFTSEDQLSTTLRVKDSRRIWHQNNSTSCSDDITGQRAWLHSYKSEKAVLDKKGEITSRGTFSAGLCIQGIRWTVRNKIMNRLPGITIFVTHSKNSFFTVIHTSFYIIAWYVWHLEIIIRCLKWQNSALIQTRLPVIFSAVSSCFFLYISERMNI